MTQADIAQLCATTTSGFCTDLSGTAGSANVQGTPTGSGYLDLKSPTTADKVQVFNTTHNGQRLDTITDLSYDSLVTHPGSIPGQAPTVQITINPHKAGITFATLVWEPIYTDTKSVDGMQEHFHPTASPTGQGGWATSKNAANLGQPGALGFNQYTASFADVLAAIPDATITTFSGLGVGQGSGNAGLESHVDNFQVNGNNWDFEVQAPVAPTLTVSAPTQLTAGNQPVAFTGTLKNNPGTAIPNARYDVTFTGDPGLTSGDVTLLYQDPTDNQFKPVVLNPGSTTANGGSITGYFGPFTGFTFPADATATTNFKIAVKAGAPTGALTSVVTLDTVNPTTGAVTGAVATSNTTITQITAPTVTINAPARLAVGDTQPVQFTGSATNPGAPILNARYDIAFTGDAGLTSDQIVLQYLNADGTVGGNVPLSGSTANGGAITGYFGPLTGFTLPTGTTTTKFQISIKAGAPLGVLNSAATLDTVNPMTGAVTGTLATSAPKTTQIVAQPAGGRYVPLTPTRITDTRTGNTPTPIPSNGTLDVQVPTNLVPAGATSVALSVTAVDATSSGFLNVYPTGATANTTSVVNFVPGAPGCTTPDCVVPNLVIAQISPSGQLTIHNGPAIGGSVDVVVDLQGYFTTNNAGVSGAGHYNTTAPTRVADTRCGETPPATGAANCGAIPADNKTLKTLTTGQSVDVAVAGQGTIPATGLSAAVVQLTTTNPTTNGYLTAYPTGTARPTASNVNWVVGQTTSNRAIVPLDATGHLSLYNFSGNTDVVVDVVGYFSDSTASPTKGALFTPVNPGRVVDTRAPGSRPLGAGESRAVQVGDVAGIPAVVNGSPTAAALNLTEATATANSFLTVTPTAITPPATTSDLNFGPGEVRANADLASLPSTGKISIYNLTGDTDAVVDAFGYFSSAAPPATN